MCKLCGRTRVNTDLTRSAGYIPAFWRVSQSIAGCHAVTQQD